MCMFSHYSNTKKTKEVISPEERARRKRRISVKNMIKFMSDRLPYGFEEWERSNFFRIMFFEKIAKKSYKGYCECGAIVPLSTARSSRMIECPVCKSKVRLTKNKSNDLWQENYFAVLDRLDDGWIQRLFVTEKHTWVENGAVNVSYKRNEEERDFCDGKSIWYFHPIYGREEEWTEGLGRQHGMGGWYAWRICDRFLHTFPDNLSEIFKGSKYQYSALEIAIEKHLVNPFCYLREYENEPKLELLYKIGLYQVAQELQGSMWSSEQPKRLMREVKSLKDLGIDSKEELEECRNLGTEILIARKEVKRWSIDSDVKSTAYEFVKIINSRSGTDFYYGFITRERWFKYYLTQAQDYASARNFINDYIDYISDCTNLGLNLNDTAIKMPKSLKVSHKWTIEALKVQENHVYDALIDAKYNALHKFVEWTDGVLKTVMPRTAEEIVNEGTRQNHCVGRYCQRVANGESIILFLRRAEDPDTNYYTMEIKPDMKKCDVVQCRGLANAGYEGNLDVVNFLKKFERWFNHRPARGVDSNDIYVKYYKAVHKRKGKYVSNYDKKVEFRIGEVQEAETDKDSDNVHVKGLHIASLEFAQKFGQGWDDVAILEVETNIHDVVIPDAHDQVRTSKFKVLREVPFEEMGEWGARRLKNLKEVAA